MRQTGYDHNSLTPFLLENQVLVVLSDRVLQLEHKYFYLGGGDVHVKLRLDLQEFLLNYKNSVVVSKIN